MKFKLKLILLCLKNDEILKQKKKNFIFFNYKILILKIDYHCDSFS